MSQQWQPTNPPTPPVQKGWFARHKTLSMLLGVTLVVLVCCCGGAAVVMNGDTGSLSSEGSSSSTGQEKEDGAEDPAKEDESEEESDDFSTEEENAISAAKNYLDTMPFSKKGLIEQLSSDAGDGYPDDVAETAVEHIEADVDWNEQAVKAAKNYQDTMPMSRSEMIQQLSSDAGDGFTQEQAEHAADEIGL